MDLIYLGCRECVQDVKVDFRRSHIVRPTADIRQTHNYIRNKKGYKLVTYTLFCHVGRRHALYKTIENKQIKAFQAD